MAGANITTADDYFMDTHEAAKTLAGILTREKQEQALIKALYNYYEKFQIHCPICGFRKRVLAPNAVEAIEFANRKHLENRIPCRFHHTHALQCAPMSVDIKTFFNE